MKNLFSRLVLVAVAAMGFAACQNEVEVTPPHAENEVVIEFVGTIDEETRSQFGEKGANGYPSTWSGTESACFSLNEADFVKATNSSEGSNASWSVEFANDGTDSGTIYAFSPANNSNNTGGFKVIYSSYEDVTVYIPISQSPSINSVAESVHMLAATHSYSGSIPTSVSLEFEHILAYGKMQITGLSNVEISSVSITSPIDFAGSNCYYYYNLKTWGNVTDNVITINNPESSNYTFWFGCVPVDLNTGNLVVAATAIDGTTYTKTIALSETKFLNFEPGVVSSFSVDMSATDVVVAAPSKNLEDGDYVIAVSFDDTKYMMTANTANTYQKHATFIEPVDGVVTTLAENVWNIVYNGDGTYTIKSVSENKYLYWNDSNKAQLVNSVGDNTKMTIVADGEFYNIKSNKDSSRLLGYNPTAPRFAFYTGSQKHTLLLIPAEVDTTPSFTVSPNENQTIGATGGNIQFAVTAINGAEVSASSNQSWLAIDNDTFIATAEANDTEQERKATITFSATGCDDVEVVVTQAVQTAGGDMTYLLNEEFDNSTTLDLSTPITSSKFPNFSGETSKAYTSKYGGIKLGTSSASGYITTKSLDLSKAFTVQFDACKYNSSDTGNIVVTVGEVNKTISNSELGEAGTFNTYTLTFNAATTTSAVKIATSAKRAYIDNVKIFYTE